MKRTNAILILSGALFVAGSVQAAPLSISGEGPLFIKFSNREQISVTGTIDNTAGGQESNWGILNVDTIRPGFVTEPPTATNTGEIASASGQDPLFTGGSFDGGQVTGMFYGLQLESFDAGTGELRSTGGFLDLYWDEAGMAGAGTLGNLNTALPSGRTGVDTFTNFTDGTLLARLAFDTGIANNNTTTVSGTGLGTASVDNTSIAEGFFSVADWNGDGVIDSNDGLWASALDSNFFYVDTDNDGVFGEAGETRDIRFKNGFNNLNDWDDTDAQGNPIIGASSDDPVQAYAVPEPSSIALLGLGLLAVGLSGGGMRRRRGV